MVSLLIGLLYASLQLPLDNCENKNLRNVCLSQIRENIFPQKFLLIQCYNYINLSWGPGSSLAAIILNSKLEPLNASKQFTFALKC